MKSPPKIKTISINVIRQRLLRDHGIAYLWEDEPTDLEIEDFTDTDADLTTDEMAAVDAYMVLGHGEILAARFDHCRAGPIQRAECRKINMSLYDMAAARKTAAHG